jgi:hypothetical protein
VVSWSSVPRETVYLSIGAQGYLPIDASTIIEQGDKQVSVSLERDPYGILPSEACAPGEDLIYIEDFQDNEAAGWPEITYRVFGWELMPHPASPDDIVARNQGDQTTEMVLDDSDLDNAVWRFWMMLDGQASFVIWWARSGLIWEEVAEYQVTYNHEASIHGLRRREADFNLTVNTEVRPIEEDVWHKYEVSYYEGRSEVWIDDVLLFAWQDPYPIPSGRLGILIFRSNDEYFQFYFNDISICKLDAPFASFPTPASE